MERSILCFSSTDWDGIWGSRQQVMLRFARRGYSVLFVERPAGPEHLLRYPDLRWRKLRRWREGLRSVAGNLWIASLPLLLPGRYYSSAINRINQRLTIRWSSRYVSKLGFSSPILWLYNPEQGQLIGQFGERLSVYHCIDEFAAGTAGRKRRVISALEAELLCRADIVFANSSLTYENKRLFNEHTYRIPSGADVEHFARAFVDPERPSAALPLHPAVAEIPHPIAGYIGNVDNRIDTELLATAALELPDWQFVLVGQTYPQSADLGALMRCHNVHFLGSFPFEQVPALVQAMDVCLLPYVPGEVTRYRSPLKLYEYLAAGKPIVSTDQPEVGEFSAWVKIAVTPEEFVAAIPRALEDDCLQKRRGRVQVAQIHSWDRRVDEMERLMWAYLETKDAR
ncbi:MAG: glycosyltransferase [Anaerolineae bacterium]|nr:glycosyltransferase [Anaerolineae bacterium]